MTDVLNSPMTGATVASLSIDDVIDGGHVRAVYQPLVQLGSREVVGYEALARGPVGDPLESPLELLAAARTAGRLVDLDWVCRLAAVDGALAAGLDRRTALFVNIEPETLGTGIPPHVASAVGEAKDRLRIVIELTERSLASNPARVLNAAERLRSKGFGVALDDVGADPASLALLPLIRPDVVKLDLRLVQKRTDAEVAAIANAVRAYSEVTGCAVLAEGIETDQHAEVAVVLGASLGQGWLYGRPGPLGQEPRHASQALPGRVAPGASAAATPYEIISAGVSPAVAPKRLLVPMSHHLEDRALVDPDQLVVLACFQEAQHLTFATRERYRRLGQRTALTAALAVGVGPSDLPGLRVADLDPQDRLVREWNVVVVGPHFAGALAARDLGDGGPDGERRFEFVISHDRERVISAATALMQWVAPAL